MNNTAIFELAAAITPELVNLSHIYAEGFAVLKSNFRGEIVEKTNVVPICYLGHYRH